MCHFVSGLLLKTGEIICEPEHTNSHEVLVRLAQAHDTETGLHHGYLCRWEFTPPADLATIEDLATWNLHVDEDTTPEWWDEEKVRTYCERKVAPMFIREPRDTVLGGIWILTGERASLKELVHGSIAVVANRAYLTRANLAGANLAGANLARADLDGAIIPADQKLPDGWKRLDNGVVVMVDK